MWLVVTVFDKKAGEFGGLFLARKEEVAVRMFADSILTGPETIIRQHPEDFSLVSIGSFDEEIGELYPHGAKTLAEAAEVRRAIV